MVATGQPWPSATQTLVLHAVRLGGMVDDRQVARRFRLDPSQVAELLLDFQALGLITRVSFAGTGGWTLTDRGRAHGEQLLAAELDASGARDLVSDVHQRFLPLNDRLGAAMTRWQIRPVAGDELAENDHTDPRWDDRVIESLRGLGHRLDDLAGPLAARLARFDGYAERYAAAVRHVTAGEVTWIDAIDRDSCHRVWFELHEDLIATLGLTRGATP